jgi:hypothetical protein
MGKQKKLYRVDISGNFKTDNDNKHTHKTVRTKRQKGSLFVKTEWITAINKIPDAINPQ